MIRDIFAMIGLGASIMLLMVLFIELLEYFNRKRCKHKWEFYDCGYKPMASSYIELRCKKCGEIKHIDCDIDESQWNIEYIGEMNKNA